MSLKYSVGLLLALVISIAVINQQMFNDDKQFINSQIYSQFEEWKVSYGMEFQSNQNAFRFEVFKNHFVNIETHNSDPKRTYDMGLNLFSHLTNQEFVQQYLTTVVDSKELRIQQQSTQKLQILQDIDWVAQGFVSPVKAQGNCDAGYAFCSASLLESKLLRQKKNVSLSEQQIIDCSADYTTFGCSSGSRAGTLKFAKQKGLVDLNGYPYAGVKGACKNATGNYKIDFDILQSNGCKEIAQNLYKTPMTIAVNSQTWQTYRTGIYNGCTSKQVNHDVYLVGVTTQYWKVKNSWGVRWGQYGYIRLALDDTCGICQKTGFGAVGF